ncbi:D-isomer specific 2-hydroxyacid dehydrogenase NAD-binding protein [Pseudonocardia dioxanivorans CB1190]|uniref:D-isomer specific 2-hydroxyacid dehydrogenase NAD-binding protein n=1 Tax=Pseudonocardia dioxanivorans (strain ATCC 55486 / DSM 44775 / JCM 13855 / CB1190) TaxID=675635 RepID=F4CIU8_PSEUX|nr:NAD(P)-dependent oxidoreductase [Pseudonocardia dioxanivorans]AEA22927.1 D-isomer specific 2-hydroxyacid dehydrogenase NAD-binding protein [Pseudonocardia dioxanivorans CB1190]
MRVLLVGEAAEHEADLRPHLDPAVEVVALPAEAATTDAHDDAIDVDDVVVSLRLRRNGAPLPPFRLLHVPGAGLDGIDLDALDPRTTVANVYEHEIPIAEFVLARLLEWEIRAADMQAAFGPDTWARTYRRRAEHGELHGRSLGIAGYGRIGRAIAARAAAFGMRVVAVDDHAAGHDHAQVLPTSRLPDVAAGADRFVVACPLTDDTRGMVDAALLDRMPSDAVLVNVSRAEIVDEDALWHALRHNSIGGAILDVWYRYPSPADPTPAPAAHPFWELPHAWCTPHSSAWTRSLARRRYAVIADNVERLASGRPLRNTVRTGVEADADRACSRRST